MLDRDIKTININNYETIDFVGKGNFGIVYKVKEKNTGNIYAAKISLIDTDSEDNRALLNLQREISILSKINHPSIIKFIGYSPIDFDQNDRSTIITDFYSKPSLDNYIYLKDDENELTDTQKLIIIYGIASGMEYLHSHDIIHRDLKPANILLNDNMYPIICDFGLSKYQKTDIESTLELKGTPLYLAPEIIQNLEYSKAGDVYSFGIIVFEIMTNERPFSQYKTRYRILNNVCKGKRPDLDLYDIDDSYKQLIQSCWAQDPSERFSFQQIVEFLENTNDLITESVDQKAYKKFIKYINDSKYNDTHTKIASVSSIKTMHLSHLSSTQLYKIGKEYELGLNDRTINIRKAIRCYKKAAEKGKINAYIKLGDIYSNEDYSEQNLEKSLEFYKTAADLDNQIGKDKYDQLNAIITKNKADNGDASAMNQYGVFLDSGKGVEIDKVKACEYYKRSADNGNVDGMYNYARILEDGENGVPVDYIEACKYFKSAADLGDENSKEELELAEKKLMTEARDLEHGNHRTRINKYKARLQYKQIADLGNPNAMNNYSRMCYKGIGGSIDLIESLRYSKMSAESGDRYGIYYYGLMLEKGKGTPVNFNGAAQCYKIAADLGVKEAMFNYAQMLKNGNGVYKNLEMSREYYKKSADLGFEKAIIEYAFSSFIGIGGPVDYNEALKYFKIAADLNNPIGLYRYGLMIEKGDGIEQNSALAAQYIQKAANMGMLKAITHYGWMLEHGIGVPVNIQQAKRYYEMSSQRGDVKAQRMLNFLESKNDENIDVDNQLRRSPSFDRVKSNFSHNRRRSSSVSRNDNYHSGRSRRNSSVSNRRNQSSCSRFSNRTLFGC